jgi:lysozyme
MPVLGIDVSHFNGAVDWSAVAQSEVKFAYAKATEGATIVDPQFTTNWLGIARVGLLRGAYHFARPADDPEVQAVHFTSQIATPGTPAPGDLPPALDLEVSGGLSPQQVIDWTTAFLAKAEALVGRPFVIYTGGLWRRTMGDPKVPALSSRLLWTARYGSQPPRVPQTWARWDFWQFTDGQNGPTQTIPGVTGLCDVDRFRGELEELRAIAAAVPAVPAAPAPGPTATVPPPSPPSAPAGNGAAPPWPGRFFVWPQQPTVSGDDVRAWQARLQQLQFALSADGLYGPASKQACIALQREAGIDPTGIVDAATWKAAFDPALA